MGLLVAIMLSLGTGCSSQRDQQVMDLTRKFWTALYKKDEQTLTELLAPNSPQTMTELLDAYKPAGPPGKVHAPDWYGSANVAVLLLSYPDTLGYTHSAMTAIERVQNSYAVYCVGNGVAVDENTGTPQCAMVPH